jgi:hypothetical protein
MSVLEVQLGMLAKTMFTYHYYDEFSGLRQANLDELLCLRTLLDEVITEKRENKNER